MNLLKKLQSYTTGRKIMLPLSLLMSAISSLFGMLPYIFIWLIIRELTSSSPTSTNSVITTYAWLALGTAVGGVVLYFTTLVLSHLAAFRAENNIRQNAMENIIGMPLGFFDNNTSGRVRKIIDDNASITHGFMAHQLPDLVGTILMPFLTLILIFVFDWRMGITTLIPIIAAMVILGYMMGNNSKQFMTTYMNSLEEMNTEAVEYVRGIPVVKVFQQTVFSFKNFYNSIVKYKNMVIKYTNIWEKPMSTYTVLINGIVFFLAPAAIIFMDSSQNHIGIILNFFFYILITPVFAQNIMKSMYLNHAFGQADEAIKRIENLVKTKPLTEPAKPEPITRFDISFNNVSFRYPGSDKNAIDGINFSIPAGSTVALVGPSGGGKTTLARLVPRFWDTDQGEVRIGGINVKKLSSYDLMQHISFVFQNTHLFKKSLLENIRLGNPDSSIDEIYKAVDMAQCREIIDKLPDGLDTKIGIDGTYLSGGEQQRIALARAILKDAPIIVMDEATAFTDPENEDLIRIALDKLTEGKTVLTIAHRLNSIKNVDKILVINDGKIAEQGSHTELLNKNGIYSGMWNEFQKSVKWTIGKEVNYA